MRKADNKYLKNLYGYVSKGDIHIYVYYPNTVRSAYFEQFFVCLT